MVYSDFTLKCDFTLKKGLYGIYALLNKCKTRCNSLTFEAHFLTLYVEGHFLMENTMVYSNVTKKLYFTLKKTLFEILPH